MNPPGSKAVPSKRHSASADTGDRIEADPAPAARPQADMRELFAILTRQRRSIMAVTAAALALALAYLAVTPAAYTGTVSILVDSRGRGPVGSNENGATAASPDSTLVESQMRLIASDTVLRRVVEREDLGNDSEFAPPSRPGLRARLAARLGISGAKSPAEDSATRALVALSRAVVVRRSERTYVIDFDVTSRDPLKAARLANDVAEAYIDDLKETQAAENRRDAADLDHRLADLQKRQQQADAAVQKYKSDHKITDANGKSIGEQELADLATELVRARARTVSAKAKYEQIQKIVAGGQPADALGDLTKSTTLDRLREQYAEIVKQKANLETTLGSRHPALLEVEAQLRDTRGLINDELKRIADAARNDYQVATADEAETSRRVEDARRATDTTNQSLVELGELERSAEANRAVYERYLRARQSIDDTATDLPIARVIAPALVPLAASSPKTLAILAVALFGGVFFGTGSALLREYLAESTQAATVVARLPQPAASHDLALQIIASVPWITPRAPPLGFLPRVKDWMLRSRAETSAASSPLTLDEYAIHPDSPFSKAILALLRKLSSQAARPDGARTVLITSANESVGKTTIAVNLAHAAAAAGNDVLLIDGNPAHPSLAELLRPAMRPGLVDLAGTTRVIYPLSQREDGSLHIVPLLATEPSIVARLERRRTGMRFDGIAGNFDFVIIDGPAISAGEEARIAAGAVDCIIVVTAAPHRDHLSLTKILDELDVPADKLGGAILSMVDRERAA